jgi:acetyltransferase-like isoleucine patch superfamily enzyme
MSKYLLGLLLNIFNRGVSILALIDNVSRVSKKAKVYHGAKIFNSIIDSYTYVGPRSEIICTDMGKFCSIANNVKIGLANHNMKGISTSPIFFSNKNATGYKWTSINNFEEFNRVIIGNDVWIGTSVIIMGGVNIGNGAVIGAGSIVTKDIPDYAIAVGIPARVIKYRFDIPVIEKLLEIKWWDMPESKLRDNIEIFQKDNLSLDDLRKI